MSLLSNTTKKQNIGVINLAFLFIISSMLTVAPIPDIITWVWPQWILLVVIYKLISRPETFGIVFGFSTGVLCDLLMGNKLGIHGLSFTIISYFILKMQQRINMYPGVQLCLLVFLFALIDFAAIIGFNPARINWVFIGHSVLSSLSTAIVWIILTTIFKVRRRF